MDTMPFPKAPPAPDEVQSALRAIRKREHRVPDVALVLGSGLGALAEQAEEAVVIATVDLPGYPRTTVEGHQGQLVFGRLEGHNVVFIRGRVHLYEGYSVRTVTFPVRLAHALGARRLLVTNAAGGIHPSFQPGTLMFIEDHINFAFANPLVGPGAACPSSGPKTLSGTPYDPAWIQRAEQLALVQRIPTRRGVYLWTRGPSYETPAEIRMFRRMGADAVGMSTVPEVIQAQRLGMRVLGISTITNPAAGLGIKPLTHEDVLAVGAHARSRLERLVRSIL